MRFFYASIRNIQSDFPDVFIVSVISELAT